MGLIERIRSLLPSYKWCGCAGSVDNETGYQFRVKARMEDTDENVFQIRGKYTCQGCNEEKIDVLVQDECSYDPHNSIHNRKVGVDEDDMVDYGFLDQDSFVRLLIEMRLSHSLEVNGV